MAQLAGFRMTCRPESLSMEAECQQPGVSYTCGVWFDQSIH